MSYLYGWRTGATNNGDPQAIGEELESIRQTFDGKLEPQQVVARARNEDSAMHDCFEWNDSAAADGYRKWQARKLIREITIRVEHHEKEVQFVNVIVTAPTGEREQYYTTEDEALADPATRNYVLQTALREAERWAAKYKHLQELDDIVHEIDRALENAA